MTIGAPLKVARTLGSLGLTLFLIVACASGGGATWTYAPLGPTQSAGASAGASPGGSPAGKLLEAATNEANPLAFEPAELTAPPATLVTVNYNNNSSLLHNINFFAGPDNKSPSLGATEQVTGPNALRSVTFTTPSQPGDYYFWCDVHLAAMSGHLHVAP